MLRTALVGTAIVAGCFIGGCNKSNTPANNAGNAAQQGANDASANNDAAKIGDLFTKINQEVKDQKMDDAKSDLKSLEGMKDKMSATQQADLTALENTINGNNPAGVGNIAQHGANDAAGNNDQAKIGELFTKINEEVKDLKTDDAKNDLKTLEGMKDKMSATQQTDLQTLETTINGHMNPATNPAMPSLPGAH